jgi:hypothetical protein
MSDPVVYTDFCAKKRQKKLDKDKELFFASGGKIQYIAPEVYGEKRFRLSSNQKKYWATKGDNF